MTTPLSPQVLAEVEERVHSRVPDLPVERVHQHVVALFEEWADSKVQSFLPILVEREATMRLRMPTARRAS